MFLRTLCLIAVLQTRLLEAKSVAREDLVERRKYNFVVRLVKEHGTCTGTLISPNWVLTSAHCLAGNSTVQFDDFFRKYNETEYTRPSQLTEGPPTSMAVGPDLGLIFVKTIPMKDYGQLSAVDYKAIAGHVIQYVIFENIRTKNDTFLGSAVAREGVVSPCNADENSKPYAPVPRLCVAPKCSERAQNTDAGDGTAIPAGVPGSPLFHAGKLAGVHVGDADGKRASMRTYTPVSPYLSWIHQVVAKPGFRVRAADIYVPGQYEYRKFDGGAVQQYFQNLTARLANYGGDMLERVKQIVI